MNRLDPTLAHQPQHHSNEQWMAASWRPVRLGPEHRGAMLLHFLRLSSDDRRQRFQETVSDSTIASYVSRFDFVESAFFAFFGGAGRIVALTEGQRYRVGLLQFVEAALSTEEKWRHRGLARRGFEALTTWCTSIGIDEVVLHCSARNAAMRGFLRALDATTEVDALDIDATVRVAQMHFIGGAAY